jgi:arylsulfatase A-like enzyme
VRSDKWKLIVANEGNPRGLPPVELFDVQSDPKETKNVAGDNPKVVEELSNTLMTLRTMAGQRAVTGASGAIDEATRQKLESLGYVK